MRHPFLALLSLACVATAVSLQAAVIDSESFEAPFDIQTDFDWQILDGQQANISVADRGLSYAGGAGTGGAVVVNGGTQSLQIGPGLPSGTTNNVVDWFFSPTSANDVWFSFLLNTSENASTAIPGFTDARDFFQLHFSDMGDQAQSLSLVVDNTSPAVEGLDADHIFRARAGSSGNVTDTGQNFRNVPARTHLIVGHIEKVADEYETISIFVNPTTGDAPSIPTAMATFDGLTPFTLGTFSARISALETDDVYLVDEVTIGESYADVVAFDPDFIVGDFNFDGTLDEGDFDTLANNLFTGTDYSQGDYDFSGLVDLRDFIAFREAFNAAGVVAGSIPEPSTFVLAALLGVSLCLIRRRLRS